VGIVEEDVEGEFRLIDDPVVREALEEVGEQGIATFGQGAQKAWPFLAEKPVGKLLCLGRVVQDQKSVVAALVAEVLAVELSSQPFVAVDVDLHGQGEPGGQADVQETELRIEEVEIEHEATAEIFLEVRSSFAVQDAEGGTSFHGGEDGNQAFGNALLPGELAGVVFFANLTFQKAKRATALLGQLLAVRFDSQGLLGAKRFEVLEEDAVICKEVLHALGIAEWQIALEDQAIRAK